MACQIFNPVGLKTDSAEVRKKDGIAGWSVLPESTGTVFTANEPGFA